MTDRAQFEAMLEALINDDQEQAKEIFHNIVVGKSREIYEELLAEDFSQDSGNPYGKDKDGEEGLEEDDDLEEEGTDEEEEGAEEEESDDDEEGDDSEEEPEFGGDDEEGDDEEGDEGGDMEDRVMDLEDALEDLKAEFEQLLAGEEHEEEHNPDIHGGALDGLPGMGGDHDHHDMEADEEVMYEYVNRVPSPKHGDNGVNTRSTIDNMKNDMGGSSKNIAQSHSEVKGDAGVKAGGTKGGLLKPTTADLTAGLDVHNRPGSDAGKKAFKKQVEGGGIDRQSSFKAKGNMAGAKTGEIGGQRGEQNTKSTISKRVR